MAHRGLWQELKRRNVLRAGALYAAGAWLLVQIVTQVGPVFDLPPATQRWIILAAIIGLPFWLAFAWFYEWTPQGLKRESEIEADVSITRSAGHRMDRAIIVVLAVAVVLLLANTFVWHGEDGLQSQLGGVAAFAKIPAKSIAVLPFVNMSGDAKNDYFSDGITEEILDALAQIPSLKVAARTSAFAFKGKAEDLRKVGEALDVATVLEGSVQKAGDEVRITAQLIDTRSGYHLWSEKYDRKLTSVFAVEDEISKSIAGKLQVQLAGGSASTLVAQKTIDPHAHDFYLRGLTLLAARSVSEAVDAFRQTVAIDPSYAQAWAALAEAQALLPDYTFTAPHIAYADSLESARRALALQPDTALAYVARGMVYGNQMHWADADRALRHALVLAPGDAEALNQYAQFLDAVGQLQPALNVLDRALQRDPLSGTSAVIRAQLRLILHLDDPATAAAQIGGIVAAHPESVFVHRTATVIYLSLRRYPEAETQARAVAVSNGRDPEAMALLIRGMADPSLRERAVQALEASPANSDLRRDAIVHALFLMYLNAPDRALAALGADATRSTIPQLLWHPEFDPVRNDPRFKSVLKEMGLPYMPRAVTLP